MNQIKIVSSLDKIFLDDRISKFHSVSKITMLKNQRLSLQIIFTSNDTDRQGSRKLATPSISGALADYANIRAVAHIPSTMPIYQDRHDTNYLRYEPGLYPDLLQPLHNGGKVTVVGNQLKSAWIEFDPQGALEAGTYPTEISLTFDNGEVLSQTVEIKIINALLPEQELAVTQWFHCDCLADYYGVGVFSERHWEIIESFLRTAVRNGQNMVLTPIVTPAFDTEIGYERPTVQLVDITVNNGKYSFGYDKLARWIDMADSCGIKYFEMAPFFSQWGAKNAPKIMATVDGEYKRIFGWETDASGDEYVTFLGEFIPALIAFLKSRGDDKRCYYHMSDEPHKDQIEQYKRVRNSVKTLLKDYKSMDALSNYEFYLEGAVDCPVPSVNNIEPFINGKVENLWCYYCCSQCIDVSNRLFAMPLARTRIIGTQMFKYNIAGFLQWGYNFYYNKGSRDLINPFCESTGDYFVQSGDAYSVYPGFGGVALESIRISAFYDAIQDLRAMKLCEQLYGHDFVVAEIEKVYGEVRFGRCPSTSEDMLAIRRRIDELIEAKVG